MDRESSRRARKMPKDKTQSHELVMRAAKEEFLELGYEKASMRSIAEKAGLTGGALYKHFASKEEMFSALIDPVFEEMVRFYREQTNRSRHVLLAEGVDAFEQASAESSQLLLKFVYSHFDEFQLMFHAPQGTKYADIRERMVQMEMESSQGQERVVKDDPTDDPGFSEDLKHIFFTMSLVPLFEIIEHRYRYDEAKRIVAVISEAQNYAWSRMLALSKESNGSS